MKQILLIRHGRSEANEDKTILLHKPDHAIGLSDEGKQQALVAGQWLERYFDSEYTYAGLPLPKMRMWVSPYKRTRQTADIIMQSIGGSHDGRKPGWCDRSEHVGLAEQQFGLFDGLLDDELPKRYPAEYQHYKRCEDFEGRFWARMPLGESRFDVAMRVHQTFGTFHRDEERHSVDNLIIVSHGVTIRAFAMMWCHKTFEWFEAEPNSKNCSVRLIRHKQDCGLIFPGFDKMEREPQVG